MILTLHNPETKDYEKSYLANDYSAAITSIDVKNTDRFAVNDRIMIGEMGQEKTEIVTVSAVNANGTTLTVGTTVFSHSADDPVTVMRFDQAKFYRSTTGVSGTYSVIATKNLDVDNANLTTIYDDTTGLTTYHYKMSVYHSVSTLESDFSDVITGSGWRRRQVGNIIDEILQEVSDPNEINISRTELLGYFNDVNDDLTILASRPFDFLRTKTTLARTLNRNYVDFPTDSNSDQTMWKFDRMDYNFTDTTTDPDTDYTTTIPVIGMEEFRNAYSDNTISSTTTTDATPEAMALDIATNRFMFSSPFKTTDSDALILYYWTYFTEINSEGDIIQTPTPRIYKLYAKAMYYRKRGVAEPSYNSVADRFEGQYTLEKGRYKMHDRKDRGTPRGFKPPSSAYYQYRG